MKITPRPDKLNFNLKSVFTILYYCPLEVLECLKADLQGEKYKVKSGERIWFFFLCTKDGRYDIVSSIFLNALTLKAKYEGDIPFSWEPKINKLAGQCIKHCIENGHKLLPKLKL